jgi:hypothetical protein
MNIKWIRLLSLSALTFTVFPPPASAQMGPEFQVNTYTYNNQIRPGVAVDGAGNFVVVWSSLASQDGNNSGIFGQRHDSAGNALGAEFQVNTYTLFRQGDSAVAADAAGNFVVVWTSNTQDGSNYGVFGQRYDSTGTAVGAEFQVNTYTTSYQSEPAVAADAAGNFVVVWSGLSDQDGSDSGVFGQRYDSAGTAVGAEFQVNTHTTFSQFSPAIVADAAGNFVVVWSSSSQDGSVGGIFGQRYDSAGTAVGAEFQVNTYTTGDQFGAAIAADAAGSFVVVWSSDNQDGSGYGIFGQRYDSAGTAVGAEFQVNTYTTGYQFTPTVTADAAGNFIVAWHDFTSFALTESEVFGQRYDSAGAAVGPEFQVNTYTPERQMFPAIAADAAGNFVVVWVGQSLDVSGSEIFGQRYDAAGRQSVLGKLARFVNPVIGVRRIKVSGRERRSYSGPIGDPLTYGATVEVIAHGDIDQNQTFGLPPGAAAPGVPGWTLSGSGAGWKYEDAGGVNGPVVRATVRQVRRYFLVEAVIAGTASDPPPGVGLTPPGNGTDAGFVFTVLGPGGATYCVSLGGPNGGTISNTATRFIARRAMTETECPSP